MQFPTYRLLITLLTLHLAAPSPAQRARDLGVPFDGHPGPLDAITDVKGVEVGDTTLISGDGPLKVGVGPVRTGVTVIFPRGKANPDPVYAGWFAQNGNGEMTGTTWLHESGFLETPIAITDTNSVGVVRDAMIAWELQHDSPLAPDGMLPVVAETWDGYLNDINGFHVHPEDLFAAMDSAKPGPVPEGSVGGGTGMVCYGFKGGDGTASRTVSKADGGYTVGVLVQCNCGRRPQLTIAGVHVGKQIPQQVPYAAAPTPTDPVATKRGAPSSTTALGRLGWDGSNLPTENESATTKPGTPANSVILSEGSERAKGESNGPELKDPRSSPPSTNSETTPHRTPWDPITTTDSTGDLGSIIIVVATDAPLLPTQLDRLARRATMGLARTGATSGNGSGDIFVAFSTANPHAWNESPSPHTIQTLANEQMSPLFQATVEATEEAIVNALVAAKTMTGIDGHTVIGLPHEELQEVMKKYAR